MNAVLDRLGRPFFFDEAVEIVLSRIGWRCCDFCKANGHLVVDVEVMLKPLFGSGPLYMIYAAELTDPRESGPLRVD